MKYVNKLIGASCVCLMLFSLQASAQKTLSFDLAGIRNVSKPINGINASCFYHFNKQFIVGVEVNRFFPVNRIILNEDVKISAWDIAVNIHYLLNLYKGLKFYPIAGVSHTAENEKIIFLEDNKHIAFWSFNSGAGLLWELEKWSPHIEYCFAWGQQNQQFLLAGISYEISWNREHHKK